MYTEAQTRNTEAELPAQTELVESSENVASKMLLLKLMVGTP